MAARKINKKYYFTVEGETEKWYLDWIKQLINSDSTAKRSYKTRKVLNWSSEKYH